MKLQITTNRARKTADWLPLLLVLVILVFIARTMTVSILTVKGDAFSPLYQKGDMLVVNHWSYGLRTGGKGSLFCYGRLLRSPVRHGDIIAFDSPSDSIRGIMVGRCKAVPGDTIPLSGGTVLVPGLITCARENYYWVEMPCGKHGKTTQLGLVAESKIIGRVVKTIRW